MHKVPLVGIDRECSPNRQKNLALEMSQTSHVTLTRGLPGVHQASYLFASLTRLGRQHDRWFYRPSSSSSLSSTSLSSWRTLKSAGSSSPAPSRRKQKTVAPTSEPLTESLTRLPMAQ